MTKELRNFTTLLDEYLKEPQFAADFLTEALEEENFDVFLLSLKDIIRVHGNLTAFAKKAHLSRNTLYKLFSEKSNPEMKTVLSILDSLGYSLKVTKKPRATRTRSRKTLRKMARPTARRRRHSTALGGSGRKPH